MAPSPSNPSPVLTCLNGVAMVKAAVTDLAASIVSVIGLEAFGEPGTSPVQFVNKEPEAGTAVRVTLEPAPKEAVQVEPQSMPGATLVTLPLPVPFLLTTSW